jgi:Protein of unknown function (DUF616).
LYDSFSDMRKFAVYTAVIGNYDAIYQPRITNELFDYILFSDVLQEGETVGVWQIRRVSYKNEIQTKIARYVKTHPETLLPDYQATLWMDANIVIASKNIYERFFCLFSGGVDISSICHPERKCVYDEMLEVLRRGLENEDVVVKWGHVLRQDHYPRNNGLIETNILFRRNNKSVYQFDEFWWQSILNYSRRDQLSFNYCLWKLKMDCPFFFPKGEQARNSDAVKYSVHVCDNNRIIKDHKRIWLLRYLYKHPDSFSEIAKVYYVIYGLCMPQFTSKIFGQLFRIKDWWSRNVG